MTESKGNNQYKQSHVKGHKNQVKGFPLTKDGQLDYQTELKL